ncbi:uncharacterized protein EAE97_002957 [Botrytis byssoidea]|uniref:Cytochrome P450 n=1 Tax=Botrytis byssoidea TaxID=139641 RepID=A0A9P5IPI6_9HELO|nr:uncharacterized protein EAE97_002957 [Botrytis byssoidea]KAF7949448.1 hypothetical protein EAE97_002957 [Botrytis byssoidea]
MPLQSIPAPPIYKSYSPNPHYSSPHRKSEQPMTLSNITEIFRANNLLWFSVVVVPLLLYSLLRSIYNLYFHALSRYPGPKLAAISNAWYAYNCFTGKWPWKIEEVSRRHGDVVRIAPNELVFLTPQARKDIHATHVKNLEKFLKTDFEDLGEDGGISFEIDPIKHRNVASKLSPAFSARNTKAKEAVLHKHIDFFDEKMKVMGGEKDVELRRWTDWLTMDVSADMTYNRQMNQMKDAREELSPIECDNQSQSIFDHPSSVQKVSSPQPTDVFLHSPLRLAHHAARVKNQQPRSPITDRTQEKNRTSRLLRPAYPKRHGSSQQPEAYQPFRTNSRPTASRRLGTNNTSDGLPRMSPGAIVDGNYIPRGRWLASKHPEYDCKYENDDPKAFLPFNQGPRMCPASAIAWTQMKLYLAKILWTFDVEAVSGQDVAFDRDFSVYTMWNKPQFWVRFVPVKREDGQ